MKIQLSQLDLPTDDLRASINDDALDELADSMRDVGLLQPIGVKPKGNDRYEVVFGARRTRAARQNNWSEIDANLVDGENSIDADAKKLIENVQRESLSPIEEAYGLFKLIGEAEIDLRKLQRQTGKNRAWIKGRLELLDLPEDCIAAIQGGFVPLGVARALGSIDHEETRQSYLKYAIDNGCTTETAQAWANHAEFATTGIMTMQEAQTMQDEIRKSPEIIQQLLNCFVCTQPKTYANLAMVNCCRTCHQFILDNYRRPQNVGERLPLDNNIKARL